MLVVSWLRGGVCVLADTQPPPNERGPTIPPKPLGEAEPPSRQCAQ